MCEEEEGSKRVMLLAAVSWLDGVPAGDATICRQTSGLVLVTFDQGLHQFDSLACHVLDAG